MAKASDFDLTVRNGTVVTPDAVSRRDLGIKDGRIVAIEPELAPGPRDIDAHGRMVLPGGIDSHCHIEQRSALGMMCADDFYSATVAAAFGGNTTVLSFAAQHRGLAVPEVLADYHALAQPKAVIDYGFHLIVANPDEQTLKVDLPQAIRDGITSLKIYMTYELLKIADYDFLEIMDIAQQEAALVMVHAENNDMIRWITKRLLERGHTKPKFHGVAHDPLAEVEAAWRAISFSRLTQTPIMIVHVSAQETINIIRSARKMGAQVMAESCPHYLLLSAEDMDRKGFDGAMFCCSPPLRDASSQEAIWAALADGTVTTFSSDHAPYRFDATGKLPKGDKTTFKEMANGIPGVETRMPLLFSEGYLKGRLDIQQFVALTATNHARLYGLAPHKGAIAIGADADLGIWNPERELTLTSSMLHDNAGYTPYEGKRIRGWPEVVINRGRIVVQDNQLMVAAGSGQYLRRGVPDLSKYIDTSALGSGKRLLGSLIGLKN